jgi:hypothetical protein
MMLEKAFGAPAQIDGTIVKEHPLAGAIVAESVAQRSRPWKAGGRGKFDVWAPN